ncbi:MFS transporter [Paenibacillus sacheonensis]|uniref:DHA2 family efflux MFS transporter permease subunit n=1 Tax=Paenibacillus sacheonensis TaxID=742054 RepID=A0A7X4YTQ2_9BACL|nr:MFS transporter [Paenibacillus sacheonensis]MBM7568577.1 EmrB/QacA subfamily drug resistance transporter [Paenibacillus sacheonensis]NBC72397.1 DHA2 family efflux MFS transporter permease subunit [Paenibacillus sacheonensis]
MFTASRVKLLVVTCAALFMAMLDNLVIGVALPSIQESFHASMSDLEWFMNAYTLAFAVLLIPFSVLGERFGRKRMFLAGIVIFTIGSALSGISESSIQLILSRALQGVGGAAIVPISLTLVNSAFPPDKRAAALGIWSGISGLGLSIGPLVGGLIVNGAPWQLIFWVNVPVGILAFFLGMKWLHEARGERKPIDPLGILLLGAGLFGIVFGLERGNSDGWGSAAVISLLAGGAALLVLFYLWERRRKQPFIRFELFRKSNYTSLVLAGFWMNAGIFCAIFLLTLFLQQAQGYSALEAGVREMAWTGCTMIAAPLAGLAVGKFGTRAVLTTGLLLQGGALLGFSFEILSMGVDFSFGYMMPLMMMAGAGMGLSFTPISHGLLSSVPESAAGEASGMSNAMRELGGVFGIAIGGLVFQSGAVVQSPADFGDHIVPALFAGAAMIGLSLLSVIVIRRRAAVRRPRAANEVA